MKTIVVAFDNIDLINNFKALDNTLDDGYRIITHTSPEFHVNSNGFFRNYDILITSQWVNSGVSEIDKARTVYMPRYTKPHMTAMINEHSAKNSYKNHIPVLSWSSDVAMQKDKNVNYLTGDLVIKLSSGARGIGQFRVKSIHNHTPRHILDMFRQMIGLAHTELPSFTVSDYGKKSDSQVDTICAVINNAVNKIFPADTVYFSGLEEQDVDYLKTALNNINEWHVESFISDVVAEYRIINCYGKYIVCKRIFNNSEDYQQASGKFSVDKITHTRIPEISDDAWYELCDLIEHVVPYNNSVDVFIKKCDDNHYFGIFEFSNQFGFMGIPVQDILDAQRKFVITKYLELTNND